MESDPSVIHLPQTCESSPRGGHGESEFTGYKKIPQGLGNYPVSTPVHWKSALSHGPLISPGVGTQTGRRRPFKALGGVFHHSLSPTCLLRFVENLKRFLCSDFLHPQNPEDHGLEARNKHDDFISSMLFFFF